MWLLWLLPALAGSDAAADSSPDAGSISVSTEQGEYNRLSEEMETLVSKSAWVGVERTFQQLIATGVRLSFADWVRGAEAAKAIGDVAAVRERLLMAKALQEDRRVLDWLWDLDQRYGPVSLLCEPGSHIALESTVSAFDPDLRRAIERARSQVHDACRFEGLLPVGSYALHDVPFEVIGGRPPLTVDLRGVPLDRDTRRKLKQAWLAP